MADAATVSTKTSSSSSSPDLTARIMGASERQWRAIKTILSGFGPSYDKITTRQAACDLVRTDATAAAIITRLLSIPKAEQGSLLTRPVAKTPSTVLTAREGGKLTF